MNGNIQKRYEMAEGMMGRREYAAGIECLEQNMVEESSHALSMSLLGNILVRTGQDVGRGIHLCNKAIELDRENSEHYIRLADIYRLKNRKRMVIKVLKRGLHAMPGNGLLKKLLKRMGERKKPFISFLNRSNPLNKIAGRMAQGGSNKQSAHQ